jgi:hypothetical protein
MEALHQLIQNRQWDQVQRSIQLDASVAMRIDDSEQEDIWVDEARRRFGISDGQNKQDETTIAELNHLLFAQMKMKHQCKTTTGTEEEDGNSMQLRYWVGNNGSNNNNNSEAYKLRRMTLLHSLCRLDFSSQDSEHETTEENGGDGLQDDDLIMAIQTAEMIISASHNEQQPCCPCHYCPPMFFPAVSKEGDEEEGEDTVKEDVLHTSALTITDKMGGTPLHELTSCGSHHAELIKALFRGCCAPLNVNINDDDRRPTAYDLLTAPNDHGSTPLHFISECDRTDEGVLRYVLEQCPLSLESDAEERVHLSMVGDNEGDLPLHYALSNCAPPTCLALLTTLGDKRSALTPNSQHRLPVDVLIEWYNDNLEDFFEKQNAESDQSEDEEGEDDSDDDEESGSSKSQLSETITDDSEKHTEEVATADVDADESRPAEDIISPWEFLERNKLGYYFFPLNVPGKCYLCPGKSFTLVMQGLFSGGSRSRDFWESELWKQMIVLVDAAAAAIVSANAIDKTKDAESYSSILRSNPVHAAVIATKYGNFPAFALAMASPLDKNLRNEMAAMYMLGHLPLHWACGNISFLLNSTYSRPTKYQDQQNPSTARYSELVRFNTNDLGITMIQYLLLLCPEAARIPTKEHGELPLHLLLQDKRALWNYLSKKKLGRAYVNEIPFDPLRSLLRARDSPHTPRRTPWDEIRSLLTACPEALSTPSLTNHLYPFQLAATASHSWSSNEEDVDAKMQKRTRLLALENTYRLILEDPSIVYRNA